MVGVLFELVSYVFIEFLFYVVFYRIGQLTIFLLTLGKNPSSFNLNKDIVSVIGFLVCAAPIAFFTFT